ncbi:MAG: hypothetical protein ACJASC_003465 [Limimaricola cinnabarinus]|jgi:hypothetical protein|uniref:hypothetical protein n=1 Tax=Limimaricola cinnabarinus TaxID=1125964 RepID=UPI0039E43A5D
MCSLCGILGCDDHWSSAVERPGVYSRNDSRLSRRREAARRLAIANKVLHTRRMKVEDFHNTSYVLRGATGATTVFDALAHLWPEAEALSGKPFDPLDPDLLAALEESHP